DAGGAAAAIMPETAIAAKRAEHPRTVFIASSGPDPWYVHCVQPRGRSKWGSPHPGRRQILPWRYPANAVR
ncbi:hypothetical protein, partial [Ralstonia pseudosolanacearum]|uniref:hypothetical protein n=1 Tax=Ralstonia pseudosolanacearum TaxID=1310165 RepID=UPI001FFBE4B2